MVDWNSEPVQKRGAEAFIKYVHALTGLYIMEVIVTGDAEWGVLTGTKKFRWPMVCCVPRAHDHATIVVIHLIILLLHYRTTSDCRPMLAVSLFLTHSSLGMNSINFAIRTIAIYDWNARITGGLTALIVGHWTVIFLVETSQVGFEGSPGDGCIHTMTSVGLSWIRAVYLYTLCVDFVVIVLTVWKVRNLARSHGSVAQVVVSQNVFYFFIAQVFFFYSSARFMMLMHWFLDRFILDLLAIIVMSLTYNIGLIALFTSTATIVTTVKTPVNGFKGAYSQSKDYCLQSCSIALHPHGSSNQQLHIYLFSTVVPR
ncbi:hypothetical protein CPB83DRAFT_767409 [Crepidotus variabilis]|uniref:Uncharacterized protein n=1 Tax=Crepidotus variabilis TaxID=179855 RepID=A0A9P6EFE3_9AGAR|nr:hypothetical protein CPB83DRAFT_767409 [Crepidotus variabilis]